MELAENELRSLQSACRALIVRTAGGVANGYIDSKNVDKNNHIPASELVYNLIKFFILFDIIITSFFNLEL